MDNFDRPEIVISGYVHPEAEQVSNAVSNYMTHDGKEEGNFSSANGFNPYQTVDGYIPPNFKN